MRAPLRGRRRAVVAVLLLGSLVAAAGGGELTVRRLTRDRIDRAAPALGGGLAVDEPGSALWHAVDGRIPRLDITARNAQVGAVGGLGVRVRLRDLRPGHGRTAVGSSSAEVAVPTGSIAAAVRARIPSLPVAGVTDDPAAGTVTVVLGAGGLGRIVLRPQLTGGRVGLGVTGASLLGRPLPSDRVGQLAAALDAATAGRPYPLAMTATALRVTDDGLRVTLTGGATTVSTP
ncbi:LmeA family phospholipid-binding protein [Kitasatospora sp. NPDC058965]|uniref:LmeA family phospholipid-binding protein n=1 Tax=Kitasatospora sp. NPDC058965 TaxID=3346682 RepID=UPI0036800DAE